MLHRTVEFSYSIIEHCSYIDNLFIIFSHIYIHTHKGCLKGAESQKRILKKWPNFVSLVRPRTFRHLLEFFTDKHHICQKLKDYWCIFLYLIKVIIPSTIDLSTASFITHCLKLRCSICANCIRWKCYTLVLLPKIKYFCTVKSITNI